MSTSDVLTSAYEHLDNVNRSFHCCDTEFVIQAAGYHAESAASQAEETARALERQLNAFNADSVVSQFNRKGHAENKHLARLVKRGLEYYERTDGVFDIHQGHLEHHLKSYLRGDDFSLPEQFDGGTVAVKRDTITTDIEVDLNGLAKGYIVDQAADALAGRGRTGFVNGGGDMSPPTGAIAIESPYGSTRPLKLLDTDWNVATSGGYRRTRNGIDHIYDPIDERIGSHHELVTVVAKRDCMEADALATTIAALPLQEALNLAREWPNLEVLVVHQGIFHTTKEFNTHVVDY